MGFEPNSTDFKSMFSYHVNLPSRRLSSSGRGKTYTQRLTGDKHQQYIIKRLIHMIETPEFNSTNGHKEQGPKQNTGGDT